ncbi:MAG: glycosyltransferase family 4 protein [bacterium]|nr:glycosyltransferase family 4 protein [bacterium]
MKILFVLEYYYPHIGGVEILFQKLAEETVKRGNQVMVVTIKLPGTKHREYINGVEIIRLRMPKIGIRYWFTFLTFFKLVKYVNNFDIIHTTTYNAALPSWLAAKIFRKKIIITIHEVWGKLWMKIPDMIYVSKILHRFYEFLVVNLVYDLIITVSNFTKNVLNKNNVKTIHSGIDNNLFNRSKYIDKSKEIRTKLKFDLSFIALYFGRPGWAKGLEFFVQAIPEIKKQIPNFKAVLLVSKEPAKKYYNTIELIKQLQIKDNVTILDPVARGDLPAYLLLADCIVVPSISEGFGFNVAEASALEIPIVATNAGSIPEVISGNFILVEPQNPEELAHGVINMYNNKKITVTNKKVFNWEKSVDEYMKSYTSL